ncbi:transketolase [Ectothiorhodospiraceae bacterium BW-2]|nr:transketolase [Ectothiorhodospiraceae bacterium BW-2]
MRNAFADELTQLSKVDERLVLLSGDIGNRLFDKFKDIDEKRFLNCGIAEANMMGVAAGLALSGLRPFVYTITPFTTTRCFEQIRVDVCYQNVPVVIVGTGSGLSYAELGPTHHSLEDLAIMRTLPGMQIFAPCDTNELRMIMRAVLQSDKPAYIRIGKKGEPDIHSKSLRLTTGEAIIVRPGERIALLSVGSMMEESLKAADILAEQGVLAEIVSFHTVKPLDVTYLSGAMERFELIATVEEHSLLGGFGSAVAEWMVATENRIPLVNFGTADEFMHEVGHQAYARQKYGLTAKNIAYQILSRI